MRALRLSLAGTVILALLAGLSGAVAAQESEAEESTPPVDGQTIADMVEEAWATGERVDFEAVYAPDVLVMMDGAVLADGLDQLIAAYPEVVRRNNKYRTVGPVTEYIATDGDLYVAHLTEVTGSGHPTGDPIVGFFRVRDGKVIRHIDMYPPDY